MTPQAIDLLPDEIVNGGSTPNLNLSDANPGKAHSRRNRQQPTGVQAS